MLVLIDCLRLSKMRRREARREAGLLVHQHAEGAVEVLRVKMADPARSEPRSQLRLTLWHVRRLLEARRERENSGRRRRRRS